MVQLWRQDPTTAEWGPLSLDGEAAFALSAAGLAPDGARDAATRAGAALLLRSRTPDGEAWLVMSVAPGGVRLNGAPLLAGIRVLSHRDELQVDGLGRVFFSTECLPRVEPFPGADRPVVCPRCRGALAPGAPAVHCPQCKIWVHCSDEKPCWEYAETCPMCPQPTAADTGYRWTPEEL
jgi:hypothetical protein